MKRINLLLSIVLLLCSTITPAQDRKFCAAGTERQRLINEHPELLKEEEALEKYTQEFVKNYQAQNQTGSRSANYTIPVVFHILHHGGSEFISDAQVQDAVNILNRDYNLRNADTTVIVPKFQPLKANIGITFKLAQIDPWGNCTNGIEKIYTYQTESADDSSKLHYWPRDKYLNIWVCYTIGQMGAAGYSYLPADVANIVGSNSPDGVLVLDNYVGSIGTGYPNCPSCSRDLNREIARMFNLQYVWGNNGSHGVACGDDGVADTPPTAGHYDCNDLYDSTSTAIGFAGSAPRVCQHDTLENVQNYMDFSFCNVMFTLGQKARMLAALNSPVADRNKLWSAANLQATGTDGSFHNPCAPQAGFGVNTNFVCFGTPVTFSDLSYNGDVISRHWSFPNGDLTTSTDSTPVITFQRSGWQRVSLTVTNSYGSTTKSDSVFVYVAANTNLVTAPYYEDFEDANEYSRNWVSINGEENNTSFYRTTTASAFYGSASMICNNFDSHVNHDIDELISPPIDLTQLNNSDLRISFRYTLADYNFPSSSQFPLDSLVIYVTKSCGASWTRLTQLGGQSLVNAATAWFYVPSPLDENQWKRVAATIPTTYKLNDVRFKFRFYSSAVGNNFYIDNINIGNAVVGIKEQTLGFEELSIFPNPSSGSSTLAINNIKEQLATIKVLDITGKEIAEVFKGNLPEGKTEFVLNNKNQLSAGMYFIKISAAGSTYTKKLVIE